MSSTWNRFVYAFLAILLTGNSISAYATNVQDFPRWLQGVRQEAKSQGISARTLDAALVGVKPIPRVLELDQRQPERTITFAKYMQNVAPQSRVQRGRELLAKHRNVLEKVSHQFGVPAKYVVALWGIESDFGRNTGGFNIVPALATLAYDGRRSEFFRKELLNALRILDAGHTSVDRMKGSWAGAMGQCQFMPSSFLSYAVDFTGDGRRDIWGTEADVFASAANYLSKEGWNATQAWGREVRVPKALGNDVVGLKVIKPLAEWQRLGVRQMDGTPLPHADMSASLVAPDGLQGRTFLVYDNYRVIMSWNRSTYFATAVGLLADQIGG